MTIVSRRGKDNSSSSSMDESSRQVVVKLQDSLQKFCTEVHQNLYTVSPSDMADALEASRDSILEVLSEMSSVKPVSSSSSDDENSIPPEVAEVLEAVDTVITEVKWSLNQLTRTELELMGEWSLVVSRMYWPLISHSMQSLLLLPNQNMPQSSVTIEEISEVQDPIVKKKACLRNNNGTKKHCSTSIATSPQSLISMGIIALMTAPIWLPLGFFTFPVISVMYVFGTASVKNAISEFIINGVQALRLSVIVFQIGLTQFGRIMYRAWSKFKTRKEVGWKEASYQLGSTFLQTLNSATSYSIQLFKFMWSNQK